MGYPDIGIMGFGKMVADCTQILLNNEVPVNFVLETEKSRFSSFEALCCKPDILFKKTSRGEAAAFLLDLLNPTVVFSANNNFIFPGAIVGKRNLRIINFHNAVLPSYPGHGQAIPQWIVYNNEKHHGVTWHLVNEGIDAGNILCQSLFEVSAGDTATSVMIRSMKLGIALFEEWWERFLDFDFRGKPQSENPQRIYQSPDQGRLYRKADTPNNGCLDLSWNFDQSFRFLRSMDYSRLQLIAPATIELDRQTYSIKKYRVEKGPAGKKETEDREKKEGAERICRLHYDQGSIILYLQPVSTPAKEELPMLQIFSFRAEIGK